LCFQKLFHSHDRESITPTAEEAMRITRFAVAATLAAALLCTRCDAGDAAPTRHPSVPLAVTAVVGSYNATAGNQMGAHTDARLNRPFGITYDVTTGDVLLTDANHHVMRISPSFVVSSFAGSLDNTSGFLDGQGAAALFNTPVGITTDGDGVTFVSDTGNHAIRQVAAGGLVSVVCGNGTAGFLNAAAGTAVKFSSPYQVCRHVTSIFTADSGNHVIRISSVAGGSTATYAGTGAQGFQDGMGLSVATFNAPLGVEVDAAGSLYVADTGNHAIRKVRVASLVVSTVYGALGVAGSNDSDEEGVDSTTFNHPAMLSMDRDGFLFIADYNNSLVRLVKTSFDDDVYDAATLSTMADYYNPVPVTKWNGVAVVVTKYTGSIFVSDMDHNVVHCYVKRRAGTTAMWGILAVGVALVLAIILGAMKVA
jgi:hypothetical protein